MEVKARQISTGLIFRGSSGEEGTYVIPSLPIGQYEITAAAPGYKSFRRTGLTLEVAQRLRVDITFELGAVTETITITAEVASRPRIPRLAPWSRRSGLRDSP